ncbi:cobalamin-independent methionine synthase II family protein [Pendulispora rubella]|uniref:Cobalamin-independent methionine synthase II family protein n=1 Tax=Pendulispora rubella TaxID=2741070 RepID=A0ABZ2L0X2_9BACT
MIPPYRADHVGSLLRPRELLAARWRGAGTEELAAIEDRYVLRLLAQQQMLGLDVFTDGELRRSNFMSNFTDAVEGLDLDGHVVARNWDATKRDSKVPVSNVTGVVVSKLRQRRGLTSQELPFLMQRAPGAFKVTLPSATQFPAIAYKRGVSDAVYTSHSELLWDIVAIVKSEIAALAAAGVPYIQIDAPRYSYYIDDKWREWMRTEMGVDPEAALDEAIAADNACFDAARRDGVTLAIHLCRGNNRSHWYAEGGYDAIAEKLFASLHVDRFLLEYDDARSGTFEPLRFVPRGKFVALGLVTSKTPMLETQETLRARIEEASRYVPLEHLALSPQCGFASTMEGNILTEDQQWAKLERVVQTARSIWG